MSIEQEITRINNNISDALSAVEEQGGTVEGGANSDSLAQSILSIPASSVEIAQEKGDSETAVMSQKVVTKELNQLSQEMDGKQPKGNYLTEVPAGYVTETELESKGYAKQSDVNNLSQEMDGKQPKGNYLTEVPAGYVTETELESKGYAKQSDVNNLSEEIANQILVMSKAEFESFTQEELAEKYQEGTKIIIVKEEYENLVPKSLGKNGGVYNGCGYICGYRLTSAGEISETDQAVLTGFMPYTYGDDIIIIGGLQINSYGGQYVATYTENLDLIGVVLISSLVPNSGGTSTFNEENLRVDVIKTSNFTNQTIINSFKNAKFIRVSVNPCIGKKLKVSCGREV